MKPWMFPLESTNCPATSPVAFMPKAWVKFDPGNWSEVSVFFSYMKPAVSPVEGMYTPTNVVPLGFTPVPESPGHSVS